MSHLFSSSRSPPKKKNNSPPLKKSLRFDDKSNLITLLPHDNTFFQDTFLPPSGSCDTERLHSKVFTDRTQSAEYMNTIVVPLETPFKRPPMTTLNLSGNNLSQFPVEVLKLETLCALNLSHNHLESLPEMISSLTNLDTLNVSFNSLKSLPKTLVKLDKLKDLCIEGNQISKLGNEVTGLVGLKTLNIMHNCLENLPTSLYNLESLTTFSLEWFSYTSPELDTTQNGKDGLKVIRKLLTECKRLYDEGIHHLNFQDFITTFSTGTETLNTVRSNGSTLLHRACHNGDTSVAKFLIEHSSTMINKEDNENMTPLSVSVLQNNTDIILALLKKGAAFDKACGNYGYPLTLATRKGNIAVVKELLKLGEDPNRSDTSLNTALHHAVILMADGYLQAGQIIQTLLDYGANPNAVNKEKWAPFHLAVRKKSSKTIQWLLKCNVELQEVHGREDIFNINKRGGPYKWSPMHIASYTNLPDLVQVLADAGADVFKRNAFGYTTKTGISKPGINLVLAQKYEKEMIKKHFTAVEKKAKAEESKRQRFQTVPDDFGVRFASRNRFEESLHIRDSLLEDQFLAKKLGIVFPKRKMRANPRWQSMQMEKPGEEDFYDIMQPTEPSNRTHHQPAQSISIAVRGDVNQTDIDEDFTADPNLCINVIPNFGNRARLIDRTKMILKGEKSTDYVVNMDIGEYKAKLMKKLDFDFEFCQKELNAFHECLTSHEVSLVDKLKTIALMKRLSEVIVDYVLKIYKIPMAKKMFPYYVAKEILTRNLEEECKSNCRARPKICQIVEFSNLIPNTLIKSYANLKGNEYEVRMLKVHICQFLCDLKNLAGLKFLLNVVKAPLEGAIVKREAQNSIETLKTQLLCNKWVG